MMRTRGLPLSQPAQEADGVVVATTAQVPSQVSGQKFLAPRGTMNVLEPLKINTQERFSSIVSPVVDAEQFVDIKRSKVKVSKVTQPVNQPQVIVIPVRRTQNHKTSHTGEATKPCSGKNHKTFQADGHEIFPSLVENRPSATVSVNAAEELGVELRPEAPSMLHQPQPLGDFTAPDVLLEEDDLQYGSELGRLTDFIKNNNGDLLKSWLHPPRKPLEEFIQGEVNYTTVKTLQRFVDYMNKLPKGSQGCIIDEEIYPLRGQYREEEGYQFEKDLGKGAYGRVDLCIDCTSSKQFVRKRILEQTFRSSEAIIPSHLSHVNIVKIFGIMQYQVEDQTYIDILQEFAGESLSMYIRRQTEEIAGEVIWDLAYQALCGLEQLDRYKMIHMDIKPENLLVQPVGKKLLLKIGDFGSAKLPSEGVRFLGWTPEYMAPEACAQYLKYVFQNMAAPESPEISGKTDVFALALTILYMFQKKHVLISLITGGSSSYRDIPEENKKAFQLQLIVSLMRNADLVPSLIPDSCDLNMRELLLMLTQFHAEERASAKMAKEFIEAKNKEKEKKEKEMMMTAKTAARSAFQCMSEEKKKMLMAMLQATKLPPKLSSIPKSVDQVMEYEPGPIKDRSLKLKLRAKLSHRPYSVERGQRRGSSQPQQEFYSLRSNKMQQPLNVEVPSDYIPVKIQPPIKEVPDTPIDEVANMQINSPMCVVSPMSEMAPESPVNVEQFEDQAEFDLKEMPLFEEVNLYMEELPLDMNITEEVEEDLGNVPNFSFL